MFSTEQQRSGVLLTTALMVLVPIVVLSPWIARNWSALGGFVPLRSNFGLELYVGNHAYATGKTSATWYDDAHNPITPRHPYSDPVERDHLKEVGELAYMKEKQHQAVSWIAAHPENFVELCLQRFRLYWFPSTDMWPASTPARSEKAILFTLLGLGTFGSITSLFWRRNPYRWHLFAAAVGPSLVYLVTHVDTRYRYPTFALSALLTADFILEMTWLASQRINLWQSSHRALASIRREKIQESR